LLQKKSVTISIGCSDIAFIRSALPVVKRMSNLQTFHFWFKQSNMLSASYEVYKCS